MPLKRNKRRDVLAILVCKFISISRGVSGETTISELGCKLRIVGHESESDRVCVSEK